MSSLQSLTFSPIQGKKGVACPGKTSMDAGAFFRQDESRTEAQSRRI